VNYQFHCEFFAAKIEDLHRQHEAPEPWRIQQVLDEAEMISDHKTRDLVLLTVRALLKGEMKNLANASKKRADKEFCVHSGVGDEVHSLAVALISALRRDSMSDVAK